MLQEPISDSLQWDRNGISFLPLSGHSSPSLPSPSNSYSINPLSQHSVSARLSAAPAFYNQSSHSTSTTVSIFVANNTEGMVDTQMPVVRPHVRRTSRAGTSRPSSRRALTAALELAQEAVRLDTTNDDPIGAIQAYSRSVAILSEVMESVMRGEDTSESGRDRHGRPRSVVAREEEVRRLRSIHDTYADRMNILSDIYNIDPNNPESSNLEEHEHSDDESLIEGSLEESNRDIPFDAREQIGSAMLAPSRESTSTPDSSKTGSDLTYTTDSSLPEFEMVHPPSLQQNSSTSSLSHASVNIANPSNNPRASILPPPRPPPSGPLPTRPRTGSVSNLPPPAPPPRVAPPPPPNNLPAIIEPNDSSRATLFPPSSTRPRGNSTAHKRTGSDQRLGALPEEPHVRPSSRSGPQASNNAGYFRQPHDPVARSRQHTVDDEGYRSAITRPPSQYQAATQALPPPPPMKDTPPLPPIPMSATPPSSSATSPSSPTPQPSPMTPRGGSFFAQPHPFSAQEAPAHISRTRGTSTPSLRTDGYSQTGQLLINSNPSGGVIYQRRNESSTGTLSSQSSSRSSPPSTMLHGSGSVSPPPTLPVGRLTASSLPASTASSLGIRSRSSSQPPRPITGSSSSLSEFGVRPSGAPLQIGSNGPLPRKPSFPSRFNPATQTSGASTPQTSQVSSYFPSSPLPSAPPTDPLRKPYHLMSLLRLTMTSKTGGYITRRLHVPHEVWSQGGAKLLNIPEKVRVVEVLCGALDEIHNASIELTSGMGVNAALSVGARKDIERWIAKLDEWNNVCESIVGNIGKKLGVGEGFGVKKSGGVTSWSGKVARGFDRMTNGKNLDSPASYISGLIKLFQQAQLLDEHTRALITSPPPPLYTSLPADLRQTLEIKLKRSSEFFASVVLTFVVRDLSQLLDKYAKKNEKWLAE